MKTHTQSLLEDRGLDLMLKMDHELVRLEVANDWASQAESFGTLFSEKTGRPWIPIRTMAGQVMLQHTFNLSDERVVAEWPEWPYCQYFCGERLLMPELPVGFSQISRWLKQIGTEGVEGILKLLIEQGLLRRTIVPKQLPVVVADTTVQSKAVEPLMDAWLFGKLLKGIPCDAPNIFLCDSKPNLRKTRTHLRRFFVLVWPWLLAAFRPPHQSLATDGCAG